MEDEVREGVRLCFDIDDPDIRPVTRNQEKLGRVTKGLPFVLALSQERERELDGP